MKKLLYWLLIAVLFAIIIGQAYDKYHVSSPSSVEVIDSITTIEVKADTAPVVRDSVVIRYDYVTVPITEPPDSLPVKDSIPTEIASDTISAVTVGNDSVSVIIPISQKLYETEDYRAYVSGYDAKLDSIFINSKSTVVRIRDPAKTKRFSVGLQAGYGMTPKGFQPYVGIGVSVNLFGF